MWDLENLIGAGEPGTPAPEGEPNANPDQWGQGQPEGQPAWQPEGQPADQQGAPEGQPAAAGDKYKELIAGMWENVVNEMVAKYEKVNELLGNPDAMKDLTKDELVQLYQLRDNLHKNLSEILPALQERSKNQMSSYVEWIEEPEIKDYVSKLMDELDEPEEAEALVKVVKDVVALIKWWGQPAEGQPDPANLKPALGGWQQQPWANNVDFEQAMLSSDPKVRAEAIKAFDAQLANRQAQEKNKG